MSASRTVPLENCCFHSRLGKVGRRLGTSRSKNITKCSYLSSTHSCQTAAQYIAHYLSLVKDQLIAGLPSLFHFSFSPDGTTVSHWPLYTIQHSQLLHSLSARREHYMIDGGIAITADRAHARPY